MHKLAVLVSALLAAAVMTATPATAASSAPCWKKVIRDWSDHNGVIQGRYSPHCLNQAIKHVPEDLRDYTSIVDDINALLFAAGNSDEGSSSGGGGGVPGQNDSVTGMGRKDPAPPSPKELKKRAEAVVPHAGTKGSIPGSSRSIPLPLLILGGLAVAAALASASPPLVKRFRGRLPRFRPAPGSVRPPS